MSTAPSGGVRCRVAIVAALDLPSSAMREVSLRRLHFTLDLARVAGVEERALTDGLSSVAWSSGVSQPFTPPEVRPLISWRCAT